MTTAAHAPVPVPISAIGAVGTTWGIHVAVSIATVAVPTLAPAIAADVNIDAALVGAFASLLWISAMVTTASTGELIAS